STPYMDEASRCDRVALIQESRILAIDEPSAIGSRFPHQLFAVRGEDRRSLLQRLRELPHTVAAFPFGAELHLSDDRTGADPRAVAGELEALLRAEGHVAASVEPIRPGIEDTFMSLMGGVPGPAGHSPSTRAASPADSGASPRWTRSPSMWRPARSSGSSAPTGRGRPRRSGCSSASSRRRRAPAGWRGTTSLPSRMRS